MCFFRKIRGVSAGDQPYELDSGDLLSTRLLWNREDKQSEKLRFTVLVEDEIWCSIFLTVRVHMSRVGIEQSKLAILKYLFLAVFSEQGVLDGQGNWA